MYKTLFTGVAASLLALGLFGTHANAAAAGCTAATLKGVWTYTLVGFAEPGATPFSALRKVTFDGKGKWSGAGTRVASGALKSTVLKNATYKVKADCTVDFTYEVFDNTGKVFLDSDVMFGFINNANKVTALLTEDSSGLGTYTAVLERLELAK